MPEPTVQVAESRRQGEGLVESPSAMEPLIGLAATALRHRRLTVTLPVLAGVLTVVVGLLLPRSYTATASFIPETQEASLSRLAGLAAQFGVAVPGQSPAQSPEFYSDLVSARAILGQIVEHNFDDAVPPEDRPATLVRLLRAKGADSAARREDGIKRLRKRLSTTSDAKTSVVTIGVKSRWPKLSAEVATQIVDAVIDFDLHTRQSRASAERLFTEARLEQAKNEVREAEDQLQSFLERNRQYRESPTLQFQHDRLSRELASRQQVFDALRESFERSRIEEVRNTPRITVIEPAEAPVRPDSRQLVLRVLLVGMACGLLGLGAAVLLDGLDRSRGDRRQDVEEIAALWRITVTDFRRPWRLFRPPQSLE